MAKGKKRKAAEGDIATNRYASFRFELLDRLECGMVLEGTEVKSLRGGTRRSRTATPRSATASCGCTTSTSRPTARPRARTTSPSARASCSPTSARSSASTRQVAERGLTLVPTRLYFKGSRAKVEIALAKGKDRFDKRESLKAKDQKRDMQRALSERY